MIRELVFTGFNRPAYLSESIASWNKAGGISEWDASFSLEPSEFSDYMMDEFEKLNSKSLAGVVNPERLGVLANPYFALDRSFKAGTEFSVLAEDDIVVSSDILEYFEWASEIYREDQNVLAILAYSRNPSKGCSKDRGAAARTKVFCPLVWGTWKDRWEELVKPNWDLTYSTGLPNGAEAGWDWNMMRVAVKNGKDFIYPERSRSNHIGQYGGTHCTEADFPGSQAETFRNHHKRNTDFKEIFIRDWKLNDFYPGSN